MARWNRNGRRELRCSCGRPAEVIVVTARSGRIPWCAGKGEPSGPHCPFCGAGVASTGEEARR